VLASSQVEFECEFDVPKRLHEVVRDEHEVSEPAHSLELGQFDHLKIAMIGPREDSRKQMARALIAGGNKSVHAFSSYPPNLDEAPELLMEMHNTVIIELDSNPEIALQLVERAVAAGPASATVMVYSTKADADLLLRCMRAGAREYLVPPFGSPLLSQALIRAASRLESQEKVEVAQETRTASGKCLTFMGAKGGTGVTTLACNFAVALRQNSQKSTLIIDLDLPFGDVALNLGLLPEYSSVDALRSVERLDPNLLKNLVMKHSSGLSVLPTTGKLDLYQASIADVDKLLRVARDSFDYVVVDIGARLDLMQTELFEKSQVVYLVTQAGIPELRNSNRLISQFFNQPESPRLEVIVNRHEAKAFGVTDSDMTRALTRPAQWKIPNDFSSVRQMQINATPLALANSPVSREIQRMAKTLSGHSESAEKKKFSLFG